MEYARDQVHNQRMNESYEWIKKMGIKFTILTPMNFSMYIILFKQQQDLLLFTLKFGDVIKEPLSESTRSKLRYDDPWIKFNDG